MTVTQPSHKTPHSHLPLQFTSGVFLAMSRDMRRWPWILLAAFSVNLIFYFFHAQKPWVGFLFFSGIGIIMSLIWSERSKAEAVARDSRQRLELAVNAAQMGTWSYDCVNDKRFFDTQSCHVLGIDPLTFAGHSQEFFQVIHPDDVDDVKAAIASALEQKIPYEAEYRVVLEDGNFRHVVSRGRIVCDGQGRPAGINGVVWDETDRRHREVRQKLFVEVQQRLNFSNDIPSLAHDIVTTIKERLGADAVGLRIGLDGDFPYFAQSGFPDDFIKGEQFLCARGFDGKAVLDEKGLPVLECVCGHVIAGRGDPQKPFFTRGGSFWTGHAAQLAALAPDGSLGINPRLQCVRFGYRSIALVPVRAGERIIGLLQVNARKEGVFTLELVTFLEGLAWSIGTALDSKRVENTSRETERRFGAMFHASRVSISLSSVVDSRMVEVNEAFLKLLSYSREEVLGKTAMELGLWAYPPDREKMIDMLKANKKTEGFETQFVAKTGELKDVIFIAEMIHSVKEEYILGMVYDITELKQTKQALAREKNLLRTLIDSIPDTIYATDINGSKILANPADRRFSGNADAGFTADDKTVLEQGRAIINQEELVADVSGVQRWMLTSKLPIRDKDGRISGLVGIGRDITERKLLESKLVVMAQYDALTSLPSRTLFLERANTGLAQARRQGAVCAILFVDLDHFKSVNDTLGHSVGDELLRDSALKINDCVREVDTVARLGGDEFIIFLNGLDTPQSAQAITERIREKFNSSRLVAGNDLFVTVSIGIAVYPYDGENLEELLKNADAAMYAAKETGRNGFCFFDAVMNRKAVTRMQIERGLRDARQRDELRLFYQPIVAAADGRVRGFEALLRWARTEGGMVFPDEFIPVAEETGLIIPIGAWVLDQACSFNKSLIDAGFGDLVMSVNISVVQLRRKSIVDVIRKALADSGLPPELLEIEVTESICINSFDAAIEALEAIRALGVKVSLDDFGTGFSSLSHLQRLPISHLKIDRGFVGAMKPEGEGSDLIPAIIMLAHQLKLRVVAEGVESRMQLERLVKEGCDYCQGYFFSRPMPQDSVVPFLKEANAKAPRG